MQKASSPGLRLYGAALKILSRVGEKWRERVGARWMILRRESLSRREQELRNCSYGLCPFPDANVLAVSLSVGSEAVAIIYFSVVSTCEFLQQTMTNLTRKSVEYWLHCFAAIT